MTHATTRQWLTGFFLALLAHLGLALLLIATWHEPARDVQPAGIATGVDITLFPDFGSAVQQASREDPQPVDVEPVPLPAAELSPQELASLSPDSPAPTQVPDAVTPLIDPVPVVPVTNTAVAALENTVPPVPPAIAPADRLEPIETPEILKAVAPGVTPEPVGADEVIVPRETIALASPLRDTAPVQVAEPLAVIAPVEATVVTPAVAQVASVVAPESHLPVMPDPTAITALAPEPTPRVERVLEARPVDVPVIAPVVDRSTRLTAFDTIAAPELPVAEAVPPAGVTPALPALLEAPATTAAPIEPIAAPAVVIDPASVERVTAVDSPMLETTTVLPDTSEATTADPVFLSAERPPPRDGERTEALEIPPRPERADRVAGSAVDAETRTETRSEITETAETAAPAPSPEIEQAYFAALRAWLDRHKDYPRLAQRRGEEGTVLLWFTVNRYGMVLEHAIVQSSGHVALDNSVEHLIRRAQPLPWIPPEMGVDWLQVIIPVQFRLER